jgi:hypothetical protein
MKLLLTLFSFFLVFNGFTQSKYPAIINWKYNGIVNIYNKPNGIIKNQLQNDSTNENYLHLTIIDQTKNYFLVSIGFAMGNSFTEGWIKKEIYIGAYSKRESYPMDLVLLKSKKNIDKNKIIVKNWNPSLLTVERFNGKWAYVYVIHDNCKICGWIEVERLCANSYSTCS